MRHLCFLVATSLPLLASAACSSSSSGGNTTDGPAPSASVAVPQPTATSTATTAPTTTPTPQPAPLAWDVEVAKGTHGTSLVVASDGDFVVAGPVRGSGASVAGVDLVGSYFIARFDPQGKFRWVKTIKSQSGATVHSALVLRSDSTAMLVVRGPTIDAGDMVHTPAKLTAVWVLAHYAKDGALLSSKPVWESDSGCERVVVSTSPSDSPTFACRAAEDLVSGEDTSVAPYRTAIMGEVQGVFKIRSSIEGYPVGLSENAAKQLHVATLRSQSPEETSVWGINPAIPRYELPVTAQTMLVVGDLHYTMGYHTGLSNDILGIFRANGAAIATHRLYAKAGAKAEFVDGIAVDAKGVVALADVTGEAVFGPHTIASSDGKDIAVLQTTPDGKAKAKIVAHAGDDQAGPVALLADGRVAFLAFTGGVERLFVVTRD